MERQGNAATRRTRNTFSVIHDDEFKPLNADELESMQFQHDPLDWQDSWKDKRVPEGFRNQIRLGSNPPDRHTG
jgi:hypothetical protein